MGLPFLFIPVTALAFSRIPQRDSNNASAITVLMKNIGGSFGISLIMSYLVHQQQINQVHLVSHLAPDAWGYQTAVEHGMQIFPEHLVFARIYQEIQHQTAVLAYIDVFRLLTYIFVALAIFALLFLPKNKAVKS